MQADLSAASNLLNVKPNEKEMSLEERTSAIEEDHSYLSGLHNDLAEEFLKLEKRYSERESDIDALRGIDPNGWKD